MTSRSPLAPLVVKGAFVRLDESGIAVVPQIIPFQYNPETLTRKLKPYEKPADKQAPPDGKIERAAPYDPEEEMDVVVSFDATDALEEPATYPQTVVVGVADRIAALEMLMYPPADVGLLTSAIDAIAGLLGAGGTVVQNPVVPVVLFVWGPGLIVPVKITSFTAEEQAFNSALYPIRAKVTVGIKVLTDQHFTPPIDGKLTTAESIARYAYLATAAQRKGLAAANVVNQVESVLAALPF